MGQFSVDNFMNAIGGQEKMKDICIDQGSNFLSGKLTTSFQNYVASDTPVWVLHEVMGDGKDKTKNYYLEDEAYEALRVADEEDKKALPDVITGEKIEPKNYVEKTIAKNVVANLGQMNNNLATILSGAAFSGEVVSGLVVEAMSIVSNQIKALIGDFTSYATNLVISMPLIINEYAQKHFELNKTTLAKELEKRHITEEKYQELLEKQDDENDEKDNIKKLQREYAKVHGAINLITSELNNRIAMIAKYAVEGPSWISDQMNNLIADKMEGINDAINRGKIDVQKHVRSYCEGKGQKIGERLAIAYNVLISAAADEIENKIKQMERDAQLQAFSVLQKSKLNIMALTGINIPL